MALFTFPLLLATLPPFDNSCPWKTYSQLSADLYNNVPGACEFYFMHVQTDTRDSGDISAVQYLPTAHPTARRTPLYCTSHIRQSLTVRATFIYSSATRTSCTEVLETAAACISQYLQTKLVSFEFEAFIRTMGSLLIFLSLKSYRSLLRMLLLWALTPGKPLVSVNHVVFSLGNDIMAANKHMHFICIYAQ